MSVFPKQSAHALPKCYRHLTSEPTSEIIDFYPIDFRLDINGAAYAWMGVNLLPFIDKERLLKAMALADDNQRKLTQEEKERNKPTGEIYLFVQSKDGTQGKLGDVPSEPGPVTLNFGDADLVHGQCFSLPPRQAKRFGERIVRRSFENEEDVVAEKNRVSTVGYLHPVYSEHKTCLLENSVLPPKEVEEWEIHHVDRRYFRGEASMRMVERVLGIDCGLSHRYKFGFQNNHARFEDKSGSS